MKVFKKNQLAILVISLMLITAGYLNFDASQNHNSETTSSAPEKIDLASIGDATLVNANVIDENKIANNVANINEASNENTSRITTDNDDTSNTENISEENSSLETNANNSDYFATSKLERNVMYSQMIERYQSILNSGTEMTQEKTIAQQEINKINDLQNAIMIAENLLTTKGFNENIIFVNGDSISVIIGKEELTQEEVAQVQNIISRELKAEVDNIHISLK